MTYQAIQMQSPENLEIAGVVIKQFRENLASEITDPIMDAHGLKGIDEEAFYSAAIMDEIYREIHDGATGPGAFVAMGKASAKTTLDFVQPETPKDVLDNVHNVFTAYLRNMPDGFGIIVTEIGDDKFEVWNNTQVPNDLIYGFLWECLRQTTMSQNKRFTLIPMGDYDPDSEFGMKYEVSWSG